MNMSTVAVDSDQLVQRAVQQVTQIATLPEVTIRIVEMVEDPRSAARDLHKVIRTDVALSARILKVVNSAFYGLPRQVSSVDRAIVLLGLSTVKNIALAASVSKLFRGKDLSRNFTAKDLWMHSLACGVFCRLLGEKIGMADHEELFVAGLMHDLGILVERQVFPDKLSEAIDKASAGQCTLCEAEVELIGADHQAFGAALANRWKFPALFGISTGYHHEPFKVSREYSKLAAVIYVADVLTNRVGNNISYSENVVQKSLYNEALDLLGVKETDIQQIVEEFPETQEAAEGIMTS